MSEVICAFGHSCEKCYPHVSESYAEGEEEENKYICGNCGVAYPLDDSHKVELHKKKGIICYECMCAHCARIIELNVRHNGIEWVDEEFIKMDKNVFWCKDCYYLLKKEAIILTNQNIPE